MNKNIAVVIDFYGIDFISTGSQDSFTLAPGLGFSDGLGGFGGGASFSYSDSASTQTLLDMNGDNKADLVYYEDGVIKVFIYFLCSREKE